MKVLLALLFALSPLSFANAQELNASSIRETVAIDVPIIRACYELFLTENPELAGTFTLRFDIEPEGHVDRAIVEESTLHHTELEGCVLAVARAWNFPPGPETSTIQYPFNFVPVSEATDSVDLTVPQPQTSPATSSTIQDKRPVDAEHPSKYFILAVIVGLFLVMGFILRAMR